MKDQVASKREQINQIDVQLVQLLNDRAALAIEIGKIKAVAGSQVYDPMREREVLERITALNMGPLDKGAVEEIFAAIITACREIQNQ